MRGLAEIEQAQLTGRDAGPRLLETLPWLSAEDRAALLPVTALVGGAPEVIRSAESNGWLKRLTAMDRSDSSAAL